MELTSSNVQLSLKELSCSFGGVRAISEFSCDVRAGIVVALIGPNGAGKTTIFNLCCGFVQPDAGTIEVGGNVTEGMRPDRIVQLGLGRTFQDCKVFDQLSVLENVMLGYREPKVETLSAALTRRRFLRKYDKIKRECALDLLEEAGLGDKSNSLACNLSYGQRKLLEMCRVRALEPKVFLLDEPFAGLFPKIVDKMSAIITELSKSGRTVVFIEHDMEVVTQIADRVLVMSFGRLIADGKPKAVLNAPAVLDAYLGREK